MSKQDDTLEKLGSLDQETLWSAAERVVASKQELHETTSKVGASREDAMLIEEIERRHRSFEDALLSYEIARHYSIFIGGSCAIAGIPAVLMNRWAAGGFIAVALITTLVSVFLRRHMEHTRTSEKQALAAAGAQSYMGFYIQRVGKVVKSEEAREKVAAAAHEHGDALEAWRTLVGEIPCEWVLENRKAIEQSSKRFNADALTSDAISRDIDPAELAQALIIRIAELRKVGQGNESLPLILDEPLLGVETATKIWVLDLIARSAGSIQIVYLTNDPEIAAWAKKQMAQGTTGMVEPAPAETTHKAHLSIVA